MNALSHPRERFIVGQVKKGKQLGKQLGFPTANLNTLGEIKLEGVSMESSYTLKKENMQES